MAGAFLEDGRVTLIMGQEAHKGRASMAFETCCATRWTVKPLLALSISATWSASGGRWRSVAGDL